MSGKTLPKSEQVSMFHQFSPCSKAVTLHVIKLQFNITGKVGLSEEQLTLLKVVDTASFISVCRCSKKTKLARMLTLHPIIHSDNQLHNKFFNSKHFTEYMKSVLGEEI